MDRSDRAKGKAALTEAEIALVRAVLVASGNNERAAAVVLGVSAPTVTKVLTGLNVSAAMATHLRSRLPRGESL